MQHRFLNAEILDLSINLFFIKSLVLRNLQLSRFNLFATLRLI